MILNIHSDASYLSAGRGRSRARGYFFLGILPRDGTPIKLNENIAIAFAILKLVSASTVEAELGALFPNVQEERILQLSRHEMGHPQPQTPVHVDNTTCVGIVINTIKRQRSCTMEIRCFWLLGQTTHQYIKVYYQPESENVGDYPSKAHTAHIHKHVRLYYQRMVNSPR
jgi:hypothetical protein